MANTPESKGDSKVIPFVKPFEPIKGASESYTEITRGNIDRLIGLGELEEEQVVSFDGGDFGVRYEGKIISVSDYMKAVHQRVDAQIPHFPGTGRRWTTKDDVVD